MIGTVDIVGLGVLGVMYADFFTTKLGKERVRVLADKKRIERYKKERITFNGKVCDFQYCDAAKESRPSELALFAVKYGALETAMAENAHLVGEGTVLLSVLNGIRSEEDLGRKFGREKVVHCIAQKMAAMKEGNEAVCTNKGELAIGVLDGGREENLAAVRDFFDSTGFAYSCPADMRHAMWAREMMKAAMRETILVANAEGVDLSEKDLTDWVSIIDGLNPDGEPSMRQDSKAGRKTEVALFASTICELGKKHSIDTPVNDHFLEQFM